MVEFLPEKKKLLHQPDLTFLETYTKKSFETFVKKLLFLVGMYFSFCLVGLSSPKSIPLWVQLLKNLTVQNALN